MISEERLLELEYLYWHETNDEETQEWREKLTDEEEALISTWDKQHEERIQNIWKQLAKHLK